ncbi:unnamed protein product, partial [Rotaria sp. Silwood2]
IIIKTHINVMLLFDQESIYAMLLALN